MKTLSLGALCALSLFLASCGGGKPTVADPTAACASCHNLDQSTARRAGPNLYGIVGRTAGTQPGFSYSPAMKKSGVVWTPQALDEFLASPQGKVPGTRMSGAPIGDAESRKAIIAALQAPK